jgi:hypothetical protein
MVIVCLQGLFGAIRFVQLQHPQTLEQVQLKAQLQLEIGQLQKQIDEYQAKLSPQSYRYQEDGDFVAFTIRDARRTAPTQPPDGFHIYDYVDLSTSDQGSMATKRNSHLYYNGDFVGNAPCQEYSLLCYKRKILQVLDHVMIKSNATYYFYIEADNEICVPLQDIRNLAFRHRRYFISTGIGFSGWIMRRDFLEDFVMVYKRKQKYGFEGPDVVASFMLIEKKAWSVTRQYLVSHTILPTTIGADALTVGKQKNPKHLPRCFEPQRAVWPISEAYPHRDRYGWDYFDYDLCGSAEVFPCAEGQLL